MALVGLLSICHFLNIHALLICRDSKIIVDHVIGKNHINKPHLIGWMDRIMYLWRRMVGFSIQHIYRAQNQQANSLFKKGLLSSPGIWNMEIILDGKFSSSKNFPSLVFRFNFHCWSQAMLPETRRQPPFLQKNTLETRRYGKRCSQRRSERDQFFLQQCYATRFSYHRFVLGYILETPVNSRPKKALRKMHCMQKDN